jgi:hypothetical protein
MDLSPPHFDDDSPPRISSSTLSTMTNHKGIYDETLTNSHESSYSYVIQ